MNLSTKTVVISDVVLETFILSCRRGLNVGANFNIVTCQLTFNFEYFYFR